MGKKPVVFKAVEVGDQVIMNVDGTMAVDFNATLSEEDYGALRAGYICPKCFERQSEAFPVICELEYQGERLCGFPIRKELTHWLELNDRGKKWVGPTMTREDEDDMFREADSKAVRDGKPRVRSMTQTPGGVWLPGG